MRLFSFGYRREVAPAWEVDPIREYRWALHARRWAITLREEHREPDGSWWGAARRASVAVWRAWLWGPSHWYYDGPNCAFNLGPVQLSWSLYDCKRCSGDDSAMRERKGGGDS